MKIAKYLCLCFFLILLSCKEKDIGNSGSEMELEGALVFTAYINPQQLVMSRLTANNSWIGISDNGIGIKIGDVVRKYVVDDDGNMTSDSPFYWRDFSSSTVNVSAWYPYNDGVKPEVTVYSDQSVEENYQKSDFLECDAEVTEENTELIFTHAGAKIICNVKIDSSVEASLDDAVVYLYSIAGVNEGTTIITTASHQALVVPQVIPAGTKFIGVELSDGRYSEMRDGGLETDFVIEKGYCYPIDVTVYPSCIEIVPQNAVIWDGSSADMDSGSESIIPGVNDDKWEQDGEKSDVSGETGTVGPDNGNNSGWDGDSSDSDAGADAVGPDNGNNSGWDGDSSDSDAGADAVGPDNGNNSGWDGDSSDSDAGADTVGPGGNGSGWESDSDNSDVDGNPENMNPGGNSSGWESDGGTVDVNTEKKTSSTDDTGQGAESEQ